MECALCRGKFRSKTWQGVLEEAKELVRSGVKELNLIAEDTNQYGRLSWPSLVIAAHNLQCDVICLSLFWLADLLWISCPIPGIALQAWTGETEEGWLS